MIQFLMGPQIDPETNAPLRTVLPVVAVALWSTDFMLGYAVEFEQDEAKAVAEELREMLSRSLPDTTEVIEFDSTQPVLVECTFGNAHKLLACLEITKKRVKQFLARFQVPQEDRDTVKGLLDRAMADVRQAIETTIERTREQDAEECENPTCPVHGSGGGHTPPSGGYVN